jgi:PTH1 family peptidyl-tRNA hydrolase
MGGGHAGHNGLRSIHAHIGADYGRIRMGVGHPGHKDRVSGYVLSDFAKADQDWLEDVLRGCADGASYLAAGDPPKFMNAVAQRVAPPRPSTGKRTPKVVTERPVKVAPEPDLDTRSSMQKLMDRFK